MWNENVSVFPNAKAPKPPATKINRANLPRRAKNFSKEQLLSAMRKKKECNAKAQHIVETLIEPGRTEEEFLVMLRDINVCHMDDIIQERAIVKLCGYPLCDNELKNIPKQQYAISVTRNKVYDITERKNFCSGECFKSSNFVKQQMLTSPLWLRDQEDIPTFRLLNGRQLVKNTDPGVNQPLELAQTLLSNLKIVERTYNEQETVEKLKEEPKIEDDIPTSTAEVPTKGFDAEEEQSAIERALSLNGNASELKKLMEDLTIQ
uniref:RNA polymerase II subunit B1 CTD phosphatase RPAP2 homolog n=1 Tax=Anopheles triannulatus TaxID=58253 RepID=A0A2M4AVK8_9DIPT